MAKHYSKRASKKRAHKKRRTVRKVRNTIRRKIQVGGIDGTTSIIFMIILAPFISLIGLDKIMLFLNILLILLGQQPMPMPGQRGGGGLFNFNTLKDTLKSMGSAGIDTVKAKATAGFDTVKATATDGFDTVKGKAEGLAPIVQGIKDAAPDQLNNFIGNLRSIKESGPTVPSGPSLKTRLIDKLTELKTKLDEEPAMYGNASACLQKIIEKLQNGSINIDKPNPTPVVEPIGNISDILKEAIEKAPEIQDSSMIDKITSKFTIGLGVLKTELTAKIDRLLERIYSKYGLDAEVRRCFTTLKNTLLDAIIKKKDDAIAKVMNDDKIQQAIVKYKAVRERAGSVIGDLKTRLFGTSSPADTPPVTAIPSDAEIRDLEYKATTLKALADAKKREAVEAVAKLTNATPKENTMTMTTVEQRNAYGNLQKEVRAKNTAAAEATAEATKAAAEVAKAKATAPAPAPAASGISRFNPFNR